MKNTKEPFFSFAQQEQMCQTASFQFYPQKEKKILTVESRLKGDFQIKQIFCGQPRQSSREKPRLEKFKSECNLQNVHSTQHSPNVRGLPLKHQRSLASLQSSSTKRKPEQTNKFYVSNRKQINLESQCRNIKRNIPFNDFSTTLCNSRSISNLSQNDLLEKFTTNKQIYKNIIQSQHVDSIRDSSLKRLLKIPTRIKPLILPLPKKEQNQFTSLNSNSYALHDILVNQENNQLLKTAYQIKHNLAPLKEKNETELSQCKQNSSVNTLRPRRDTAFLKQKQQMAILAKLFSKNSSKLQ